MTIHPARRKPDRDQPLASHGHTGTRRRAAAHRDDRIEDKSMKSNGPAAIDEIREGNQDMRSELQHGPPAPDRLRLPTASPAGWSSGAPSTADSSVTSDANVAWFLAVAADVCLTGPQRTVTFVELGCGEYHLAIERILNAVVSSRMTLSVAIFDRLTRWLDGYLGSLEEPSLRTMLGGIRARQCQPVRLRTQRAQWVDVGRIAAPACSVGVA
jgi:hypothetical protein